MLSEKLNHGVSKIAKFVGIFVKIEHIKNRGSYIGPKESDRYFPRYGAVMIPVKIVTGIMTAP